MARTTRSAPRGLTAGLLGAFTTYFTVLGWYGLSVDPSAFTGPVLFIALGVAAAGVALRSLRTPRSLVVVTQVILVAETLHIWWGGAQAALGVVPTPASLGEVTATLGLAVDDAQAWAAPVPEQATAFPPLMILIGAVVALLVDAIAVTYRRPALAGLPLLAAFTMPVAVTGGIRWDHFVLAGGAYLLLLAADHLTSIGHWGRPLVATRASGGSDGSPPSVLSTASMMARSRGALIRVLGPALALAVAGSVLVPEGTGFLGGGAGGGGGGGVRIENPITDLRRDLVQGPDVPLVFARTEDPDPSYLRISVLDSFDGRTWRPSPRDLPVSQRLGGELPLPVGMSDDGRAVRYRYELSAFEAFDSQWLPLPFPAVAADAVGDWRYDQETRDVTTVDSDLTTADLDYSATRLRRAPTARELLQAFSAPAAITRENTALPFEDETPGWLQDLVDEVTQGAQTDFERAVAIQRWFRDPENFTYTTDRVAGNGLDDLRTFLTPGPSGRAGYCEQFASAMAVMARVADIPARVAVGFLRPDAVGPGTWLFSAHDLHAWPELYFSGSGWVRFEPTPADQAATVPGYTAGLLPQLDPSEAPSATTGPSATAPSALSEKDLSTTPQEAQGSGSSSRAWLWAAAGLVILLVLLVPRTLRSRQRRRRTGLASGGDDPAVEAAWAEVRSQVLDLGHSWDDDATLRSQQRHLRSLIARAPVSGRTTGSASPVPVDLVVAELDALVGSVERARFGVAPVSRDEADAAWERAMTITQALWARSEAQDRRRAQWWPRSMRSVPEAVGWRRSRLSQTPQVSDDNVKV